MTALINNRLRLVAEITCNSYIFLNKREIIKILFLLPISILLLSNLSLCQKTPKTSNEGGNRPSNEKVVGKISVMNKNWQQNGIFGGKLPHQEILDKRTEYTKKFQRSDGQVDIIIGGPFHYKDAAGAWQDIDLNIRQQSHPIFSYYNNENNFTSRFAKNADDGVEMKYKNKAINFGINPSISAGSWTPVHTAAANVSTIGNIMAYKNILNDVDLEYEVGTQIIQHRMMFNNRNVFSGISSQQFIDIDEIIEIPAGAILIDSFGAISNNRTTKGFISVILQDDTLFTILPSRTWDATFNGDTFSSGAISDEIIFTQTSISFLSANKIKYSSKIPVNWLLAPNRVFPIAFDPTISIGGTGVLTYGSGWGFRYPWRTNYWQVVSQTIYRQNEINTAGNITNISYRQGINNGLANSNATIKMQTTNNSTFSSTNFITTGWTTCLSGTTLDYRTGSGTTVNCSNPSPIWHSIALTPFNYNNTQNLVIETRFLNSSASGDGGTCGGIPGSCCVGGGWYYYTRSGTVMVHGRCDCTSSYPASETINNSYSPVVQLTINPICVLPISPTSATATQTTITSGQSTTLQVVGGSLNSAPNWIWYTGGCGGIQIGTGPTLPVSPTTTTTYYVQASACGTTTTCRSVAITVSGPCVAPTSPTNASATQTTITSGQSTSLQVIGGSLNSAPNWVWYTGGCGGTQIGTGATLSVSPTATTTYYVQASACGTNTTCRSVTITVTSTCTPPNNPPNPTSNSPQSNSVIITRSGTPPAGVTWYWQGISCGINTSLGSGATFTATASGRYYIRAYNNTSSCWSSSCGFVDVTVTNLQSSITITSSTIPPWQRQNDAYQGSVTVSTSNPSGASWHLQVKVYNSITNTLITTINYLPTTSATQNFYSTDPQLNAASVADRQMKYFAVLDANGNSSQAGTTDMIESKWNNKNYVYYNSGTNEILIPLKYFSNTISTTISFSRFGGVSNFTGNITNVPTVQFGNQEYYVLNNVNSLIQAVRPGVFNYTISYNPTGFFQESGTFDLTKIGNVHNANSSSNQVVVLVGGIRNDIENDITSLSSSYNPQSNSSWSIANDLSLNYGRNTWYIAQGNTNSTQKNAYNLGIALQEIRKICINNGATNPQISVIAHSKGGLEMRVLLDGKAAPISSPVNFTMTPSNPFTNTTINGSLKSVIFLGTPHHGSNFGYAIQNTPGGADLLPTSQLIQYLNSPNLPQIPNIRIANITGYQISALGNAILDINGDGLVTIESSSENINLNGASLFRQFYIAVDYNPFGLENYLDYILHSPNIVDYLGYLNSMVNFVYSFSFHSKLHKSNVQNNVANSCANYSTSSPGLGFCQLTVIPGTSSTLSKILSVIDNNSIPISCINPNTISCFSGGQTFASLLSNSSISKYIDTNNKILIAKSDENGKFQFQLSNSLTIGDKIIIEAPGIESLVFTIDSNTISENKLSFAMLKNATPTQKIKYPMLKLSNQIPITANPFMPIIVKADNAIGYEIATNADIAFRPLSFSDTTSGIPLDTGLNIIVVRYLSIVDTVVLGKVIYYFPGSSMNANTRTLSVSSDSITKGTKVYVNSVFYKEIYSANTSIPVLFGHNSVTFSRFGFKDITLEFDSIGNVNLPAILAPVSYSSLTDSSIVNFSSQGKIQYRKNVTVMDSTRQSIISIKQYDDNFSGMGLTPKSRKFEMRHLNSSGSGIRFAAVLDQIEDLSKDSIYLMHVYDNTSFTKIPFDVSGTVAGYDSTVQKLTYNYINFNNGAANKEALVIMKKKAAIVNNISNLNINENDSLFIPLAQMFSDPDSIHNDMTFQIPNANPTGVNISIRNGNIIVKTSPCYSGNTSFALHATHDGLTVSNTISVTVIATPPPVITVSSPTTFCQGGSAVININLGIGLTYQWKKNGVPINGATSSSYTATTSGDYKVSITNALGCLDSSAAITIAVNPLPSVSTTPVIQTVCSGTAISQINNTNPNNVAGTIFTWTRDNTTNLSGLAASGTGTNITGTLTNTTNSPQTTAFTITATANGCYSTTTTTVTVNPKPSANSTPATQAVCSGAAINQINNTNPNNVAGTTFNWIRDNTTNLTGMAASGTGTNISGTLANTANVQRLTTFTISAIANGCSSTTTAIVMVNPKPAVSSTPATQTVCSGTAISQINNNNANNVAGTAFTWTRNNTTALTGIAASGTGSIITGTLNNSTNTMQTTTFIIRAASNGCFSTATSNVIVNPGPSINLMSSFSVNLGERIRLGGTPVATGYAPFSYKWTPNYAIDNDTIANPIIKPHFNTTYTLRATDRNGCSATKSIDVVLIGFTVLPNPTTDIVNIYGFKIDNRNYQIKVIEMNGKIVISKQVHVNSNNMNEQLSIGKLPNGIYFISIQSSYYQQSFKIMKIQ
jgi:hypothetical protein